MIIFRARILSPPTNTETNSSDSFWISKTNLLKLRSFLWLNLAHLICHNTIQSWMELERIDSPISSSSCTKILSMTGITGRFTSTTTIRRKSLRPGAQLWRAHKSQDLLLIQTQQKRMMASFWQLCMTLIIRHPVSSSLTRKVWRRCRNTPFHSNCRYSSIIPFSHSQMKLIVLVYYSELTISEI